MTVGQLVEHRDDEPFAGPLRRSPLAKLRPLLRSPGGFVGASIFILLILLAVFAPLFAPQDPLKQSLRDANTPPFWMTDGSTKFLVGTDALGRDILSRLIYGSRVSLTVAVGGVLIAATLGMLLGLIAGYRGGRIDRIIVGGNDLLLSVPYILLVVVIAAVVGTSLVNVILIFGFTDIPIFVRVTRGEVLKLKESTFVEAARGVGVPRWRILWSHLVPNLVGPIGTLATFEMSSMILYEAGLGFLGLSVPPSTPSWGNMINAGRGALEVYPWISIAPGVAIVIAGMGLNLLGDWSRDALDPRSRRVKR
ncbi:ABC transporter permease [Ilumatobacter sp.]|uniref:ABC transporter permease n=1 Tax=Ilumatobacter sp. TaxID=1967498 RepID=UPI0037532A80